jgi:hypothetical protein
MKPIRVASEREFERLLDHLAHEAHRISDHWLLLQRLGKTRKTYGREMHDHSAFWHFTLRAHSDAVLFRLARIYDQHECALSLKRFLLTLKDNPGYFSDALTRSRLAGNPFAEQLVARKVKPAVLGADIRRVSDQDPLVAQLCQLRNRWLSHVEPNPIRLGGALALPHLSAEQIGTLLRRARRIVNRYSLIYRASALSTDVVGADDYKEILKLVRKGRDAVIAERNAEIRSWRNPRPKRAETHNKRQPRPKPQEPL